MSYQFWVPIPNEKISCLLSHEKISCLKRKYYVLSVFGPLLNEKISCLLSHEKISCSKRKSHVFSVLGPPLMRKSPVSCLMRKSHVSRENLMSYQFWPPQWENLLSPVSWENLMSQEKISYLKRKSHVSRENLMSYQFWAPPPTGKYPVSCLMRKSLISPIFLYHTSMSANIIPPVS